MALVAQSVAVAQADLDRAKVIAAEALANYRELSARKDAIYAQYGATSPEAREIRSQTNAANAANREAQAVVVAEQEILTGTIKRGGFNENADPAAANRPDPLNSVSVNQIQTAATNPEVTVTPVDTVPTSQVRTNAVGLPAATLVEEAGLDIQNNKPIGPDPFAEENAGPAPRAREIVVPGDYEARPNNNGSFDVVETQTGTVVASGLDEQEAILFAQDQAFIDEGVSVPNEADGPVLLNTFPEAGPNPYNERQAYDQDGFLLPGFALTENNDPVFVGYDFVEPATQASAAQSRAVAAGVADARRQQTLLTQQRTLNKADWRVRLSLADNSSYLYNVAKPEILAPLQSSNGVIFPYTPQITTSYKANYSSYDLTHSNYRGYFYQNSYTDNITITATFTAQNTQEANYLLAVIHFFRSVTKMFYGQSQNLGSPPPMCFLTGLGDFQFNKHPVLVTQFNYSLPSDVDYIRAGSANNLQLNQNQLRNKKVETTNNSLRSVFRLANALLSNGRSLPKGAQSSVPTPSGPPTKNPTYVPTKMDIVITLLPVASRQQVSQVFNLQEFANGNQLRGGFW